MTTRRSRCPIPNATRAELEIEAWHNFTGEHAEIRCALGDLAGPPHARIEVRHRCGWAVSFPATVLQWSYVDDAVGDHFGDGHWVEVDKLRAELDATKKPVDPERAGQEERWMAAIDWLLNSRHTGDPDIQGPFWAHVDGLISRDELDRFYAADVLEREAEIAQANAQVTSDTPQPSDGPTLTVCKCLPSICTHQS